MNAPLWATGGFGAPRPGAGGCVVVKSLGLWAPIRARALAAVANGRQPEMCSAPELRLPAALLPPRCSRPVRTHRVGGIGFRPGAGAEVLGVAGGARLAGPSVSPLFLSPRLRAGIWLAECDWRFDLRCARGACAHGLFRGRAAGGRLPPARLGGLLGLRRVLRHRASGNGGFLVRPGTVYASCGAGLRQGHGRRCVGRFKLRSHGVADSKRCDYDAGAPSGAPCRAPHWLLSTASGGPLLVKGGFAVHGATPRAPLRRELYAAAPSSRGRGLSGAA